MPAGIVNKAIALKNCRNATLRDLTIYHGGAGAMLLTIDTNHDGMDLASCQNVRVAQCTVNSPYADAICLKSSYALGEARATENVTVTNC